MGGAGGVLAAGYLDISNPTGWITGSAGSSATATTMTFTNTLNVNMPLVNNTFHYSVGTSNTLPNPIVPVYSRLSDASVSNPVVGGSWNDPNSWTTSSSGFGAALGAAPTGVPVVILSGARINMNVNGRIAFTSQNNGLLVLSTSFGHNLGIMSGTGTMRTATNTFPAGNYTVFVSSSGGTIEYVAPMTMNNRSTYNSLLFSGAGTVTMTNTDLTLNGSFTNPAGVTVNNAFNRNISIARDWSNSGTFTTGTGTVIFNGSLAQSIIGTTVFNNLTVSKPTNLTLTGTTTINGVLTLTNGNIVSSAYPAAPLLLLGSASSVSGGSSTSFVSGQIRKTMNSGTSFAFPLGSIAAARFRPATVGSTSALDTWDASYIGNNPTTDGYSNTSFNVANMAQVSQYEYWQVACASGTSSASLTLSFGAGSYGGSDVGILSSMKTVRWTGAQWDLPPGGGTFSQSGTNVTGTVTVSFQNAFSPQTLATDDNNSTLPIELLEFTGKRDLSGVILNWKTAQEINSDRFEIERSPDGSRFSKIGTRPAAGTSKTMRSYQYVDKEVSETTRYYYRLRQVDNNGSARYSGVVSILAAGEVTERWAAFPNPIQAGQLFEVKLMDTRVDNSRAVQMMLISFDGRVIFKGEGLLDQLNPRLVSKFDDLSTGIYLLQIGDGEIRKTFRIVRY